MNLGYQASIKILYINTLTQVLIYIENGANFFVDFLITLIKIKKAANFLYKYKN